MNGSRCPDSKRGLGIAPREPSALEGLKPHRDDRQPVLVELCVGTNIRVAPMEFLEAVVRLLQHAMDGADEHADGGTICLRPLNMAVVRTCNRAEFYMAAEIDVAIEMIQTIRSEVFVPAADLVGLNCDDLIYVHRGPHAVRHLCRVATGLDSLAIGEHQIQGQVASGFARTIEKDGGSRALLAMAEVARNASRRARLETGIGRGRISLSSVGVELAEREIGTLSDRHVLVVGAGKVGRLVCRTLNKSGGGSLTVVNRTVERARALADDFGGTPASMQRLAEMLADSDVVFSTTGSLAPVLTTELVTEALADRSAGRPLGIVDLAVPRDVEPGVGEMEGVRLFGLTDLRELSDSNMRGRHREVGRAEAIVDEEVAQYQQARETELVEALLAALWQRAEALRTNEVERLFGAFDGVDPEMRDRIMHFSRSLVRKLLHEPSLRLRASEDGEDTQSMLDVLRELFDLEAGPRTTSGRDGE